MISDLQESDICFIRAEKAEEVTELAAKVISEVYPLYYPQGAVAFFLAFHSRSQIEKAMNREEIYLMTVNGTVVGTGSIRGNEICRLFILPASQRQGYGSRMMDWLEERISMQYSSVKVDASFPAEHMYLKRGYLIKDYEQIRTETGDYLCYHRMEKTLICRA